ncbi:MAG: hypothetical protein JWP83_6063 [Mycobacterium sp.]|jgi:hypothetical protein|uniref:hypothetical protein n=1 Tax=Mycobacterium sp. TaxID=1785 RepID=UPI00260A8CC2|nr:hypothetical protein [Mycobacterium sp.]MCW2664911.1 hypothetical protein [Mycobacterium sp.]
MSVQDDKVAGPQEDQQATDQDSGKDSGKDSGQKEDRPLTEKPEPDEGHKKKAAEMMTAYEDRPTLVLPGSGAMVTGTAVNDWLDEDGNPKCESPDDSGSEAGSDQKAQADEGRDDEARKDQIEKDKALNEELKKAGAQENKGEKRPAER